MKLRLARPEVLLDIGRLEELHGVRRLPDGRVAVGALTTYEAMIADPILGHYGLLRDALPNIGDVQVRNRGTIGGSIAHADPASDMPAILLALDAEVVVRSAAAERTIPITDVERVSRRRSWRGGRLLLALIGGQVIEVRRLGPTDTAVAHRTILAIARAAR